MGKLRCRWGFHKWAHKDIVEETEPGVYTVITYTWCRRCTLSPMVVNVEIRRWVF